MNNKNKDQDKLLDHDNDGIKEYDNDLPKWWVQLFWLTGIVGVMLAVWFHLPSTPTPDQALAQRLAELDAKKPASAELTNESLLAMLRDSKRQHEGQEIFVAKCVACYGPQGQGIVGPNLTDNHWIHGNTPLEIKRVIEEGVLEKGMLSWKTMLKPDEILDVSAYVWSLKGTTPPNPKAPEGIEYK